MIDNLFKEPDRLAKKMDANTHHLAILTVWLWKTCMSEKSDISKKNRYIFSVFATIEVEHHGLTLKHGAD